MSNDIELKEAVLAELAWEPSVTARALHRSWFDPQRVKVSAEGGKVTLTGYVESWNERALAGSTAWAAPGATDVENHLIIA